jgi:hypothetical protein
MGKGIRKLGASPESERIALGELIHQHVRLAIETAPGCTNPGGAFTSERDGEVYEFCSEACRAKFERPAA